MATKHYKKIQAKLSHVALAALAVSGFGMGSASAQSALDYAGHWKFDTCAASSVMADSSGNNNSAVRGAFLQCTTGFDGLTNGAVNFVAQTTLESSAAHNVGYGSSAAQKITNQFALSLRIKPSSTGAGGLLTKSWSANGQVNRVFQFYIQPNSSGNVFPSLRIWYKRADGTIASNLYNAGVSIPTNQWTQLGASYDPVNGVQFFVNGVRTATGINTPLLLPAGATIHEAPTGMQSTLFTGGKSFGQVSGNSFLGAVDDVWFSNGSCTDLGSTRAADVPKELMITAPSVVDDPRASNMGRWSFGGLVSQMVPANPANPQAAIDAAADMVENMFRTWDHSTVANPTSGATPVVVNGQTLEKRSAIMSLLSNWFASNNRTANGKLNLAAAPLRLTAIVNRMDLRDLSKGSAGEGRFVFNVLNNSGGTTPFTVILEYNLPATTEADIRKWGDDWHKLGLASAANYNAALQAITDRFSLRGAQPNGVNGNPLKQLRTNERAIGAPWDLRQFELEAVSGTTRLAPRPVGLTPAASFNNTTTLGNFLSANAQLIMQGKHDVPLTISNGSTPVSFLGGAAPITGEHMVWNAPNISAPAGINPGDVRFVFALNTCSGCHKAETGTNSFLHVGVRTVGQAAPLSGFLTGTSITDPGNGVVRSFNDLARRRQDMVVVLQCPAPAGSGSMTTMTAARMTTATATTSTTSTSTSTLSKGISRVH